MSALLEKRRCPVCRQRRLQRVRQPFEYVINYDGRSVSISIPELPVVACMNPDCRPEHPDDAIIHDDTTTRIITEETYRQLGLLTPDEIRQRRDALDLTQQQMQARLGLGGNTMSRWEQGHVYQSRALDRFMRVFFASDEARQMLETDDRTLPQAPKEASFDERYPRMVNHRRPHDRPMAPFEVYTNAEDATQIEAA